MEEKIKSQLAEISMMLVKAKDLAINTKQLVAKKISDDVLLGIFTISEENQSVIRYVSNVENGINNILSSGNTEIVKEEPVDSTPVKVVPKQEVKDNVDNSKELSNSKFVETPSVKEDVAKSPVKEDIVEDTTNSFVEEQNLSSETDIEPSVSETVVNEPTTDFEDVTASFEKDTISDYSQYFDTKDEENDVTSDTENTNNEDKEIDVSNPKDSLLVDTSKEVSTIDVTTPKGVITSNTLEGITLDEELEKMLNSDENIEDALNSFLETMENKEDEEEVKPKAQVIGSNTNNNLDNKLPFYGEITNERSKNVGEFIFNSFRIMATHPNFNASTDIFLYVAPLQVIPNNPNVPIIAHAYAHGLYKTISSYESKESGHSIVTLSIDDFELLIRGGFDADGKFEAYVMTTGLSANQGDKLNFVSKNEGYTGKNLQGSGHIKFKEADTLYEIFPLSTDTSKNEYVCLTITDEFLDYHIVAKNYGTPRIKIDNNGVQNEVIAGWAGNTFEADII